MPSLFTIENTNNSFVSNATFKFSCLPLAMILDMLLSSLMQKIWSSNEESDKDSFCFFWKIFWRTFSPFMGPQVHLFWTSVDVYPGFEPVKTSVDSLTLLLHDGVRHLLASWLPAGWPSVLPTYLSHKDS